MDRSASLLFFISHSREWERCKSAVGVRKCVCLCVCVPIGLSVVLGPQATFTGYISAFKLSAVLKEQGFFS